MVEDWRSIIKQLEATQKTFPPGDPEILNVASIIQSIEADALGGNLGHAQYFLHHPEDKASALAGIRKLIAKYLPQQGGKTSQT